MSGDGNDSDGAGDFNDYYKGQHADYDGHGGDHTSDNITGWVLVEEVETTPLMEEWYIHGNSSNKAWYGSKRVASLRETVINVRDAWMSLWKSILWLGSRYVTLFSMHLAAINLRLGLNAFFHTHLFADSWVPVLYTTICIATGPIRDCLYGKRDAYQNSVLISKKWKWK